MVISRSIYQAIAILGEFTLFMKATFSAGTHLWKRRNLFIKQCEFIGVTSTGVVVVAAFFMGSVLGYQLYTSLHLFGAEALLGGTVGVALYRELAPALTAVMVTGRAGAAMAAEISSMRISEQIDALEVMAINPMEYLVAPRVLAAFLMLPLLGIFFAGVASVAASWIACGVMGLSYATYWDQFSRFVDLNDVVHLVVKSSFFGLILSWMGCFCGFRARGGAFSVGFATRTTVVASCLTILISDYYLTSLLPFSLNRWVIS